MTYYVSSGTLNPTHSLTHPMQAKLSLDIFSQKTGQFGFLVVVGSHKKAAKIAA